MGGQPNIYTQGFVYQESDPPLTGEDRKRDMEKQRMKWRWDNDPAFRSARDLYMAAYHAKRVAAGVHAEYQRRRAAEKRARQLAVAREYGAEL